MATVADQVELSESASESESESKDIDWYTQGDPRKLRERIAEGMSWGDAWLVLNHAFTWTPTKKCLRMIVKEFQEVSDEFDADAIIELLSTGFRDHEFDPIGQPDVCSVQDVIDFLREVLSVLMPRVPSERRQEAYDALMARYPSPDPHDERNVWKPVREKLSRRYNPKHRLMRWRRAARLVGKLQMWHRRAAERAYAPDGGGFLVVRDEFEELAASTVSSTSGGGARQSGGGSAARQNALAMLPQEAGQARDEDREMAFEEKASLGAGINKLNSKDLAKVMSKCVRMLESLMQTKAASWFLTPVNPAQLGLHDYFSVIKNPMDLGTVKTRLLCGVYQGPEDFAKAVTLTFANAMTYNPPGTMVHADAAKSLDRFEKSYASMVKRLQQAAGRWFLDGAPSEQARTPPTLVFGGGAPFSILTALKTEPTARAPAKRLAPAPMPGFAPTGKKPKTAPAPPVAPAQGPEPPKAGGKQKLPPCEE